MKLLLLALLFCLGGCAIPGKDNTEKDRHPYGDPDQFQQLK